MGCTIGAKVFRPGREYVLFKNKDLGREWLEDILEVSDDALGVMGIEIPAPGQQIGDTFLGYSIGLNRAGVSACNSHVRAFQGATPYDALNREALIDTATADEARDKVVGLVRQGAYDWGNIVIADPGQVIAVEVAVDAPSESDAIQMARSNTHVLSHDGAPAGEPCGRLLRAREAVRKARGLDDIFALLRSHDGERPVCTHTPGNTVYSYLLHWVDGAFTLYVCQGHPCERDYVEIPLRFPLDPRQLGAYPTKAAFRTL